MHDGEALLGIFLATYSSKGDYLPLRYPMTPHDCQTVAEILKEKEMLKRASKEATAASSIGKNAEPTESPTTATSISAAAANVESPPQSAAASAPAAMTPASVAAQTAEQSTSASVQQAALSEAVAVEGDSSSAPEIVTAEAPAHTSSKINSSNKEIPSRNGSFVSVNNARPSSVSAASVRAGTGAVATAGTGQGAENGNASNTRSSGKGKDAKSATGKSDSSTSVPYLNMPFCGFEHEFLAQLFSPRPSMSDRRFQVAIDQVLFVGHPLRDDPKEKARNPDFYDAEQDDAETMSRLASMAEMDGWKVKSEILLNRGGNQQGTKLLADLGLVNLMLNREPSEAGDSAISDGERAVRDSKEWKRRGYRKRVYPALFHVVLMLDNTFPGIDTLADRIYEHVLRRLTKTLMIEQVESNYVLAESRVIRSLNETALAERYSSRRYLSDLISASTLASDLIDLYDGLRRGELVNLHVRKRIMLSLQIPRGPRLDRPVPALRIRTPYYTGYATASGHGTAPSGDMGSVATSKVNTPRPETPATPAGVFGTAALLQAASQSIAPDVQEYWGPLEFGRGVNTGVVGVKALGSSVAHAWAAHGIPPKGSVMAINSEIGIRGPVITDRELQIGEHDRYPRIEPYHALLLLEDADGLSQRLQQLDASPTLITVVEKASIKLPLFKLYGMMDCSFAQLCRFAAHLVYWNVARLICPVSLGSTYVPAGDKGLATPGVSQRFDKQGFTLCTLPQLLARLHPPRASAHVLETLVSGEQLKDRYVGNEFREMLAFLLRENMIAQLHTWPLVLVPNYVKFNLNEEQFVRLAFAWFRTLYTEHPDLLSAFPQALIDRAEMDCWVSDESRERADVLLVYQASRDAEGRVMLCRVMHKLALRRMRDAWEVKRRGKHGQELHRLEKDMADEEDRIHVFCNRLESERMDAWIRYKAHYEAALAQSRRERIHARRALGRNIEEGDIGAHLYRWYDFIKKDPDLGELAREIVDEYVTLVPADPHTQRSDAETRFLTRSVENKPASQQDWFIKRAHLFTGTNNLVKLAYLEQSNPARLESMLRKFEGIIRLPQHV
ncbi:Nitrogen permease regulator 3 [Coemansia sp. RSA 1721]|nr:Nitrogen permease regulator 3 [Coemansia sp. RSA 1721]